MTISINTLANLSERAYLESNDTEGYIVGSNTYTEVHFDHDASFWQISDTGFTAHAYYSEADNTLVIAYAGTDPISPSDFRADWGLATSGDSTQLQQAYSFAVESIAQMAINYPTVSNYDIVFTGHSLGGFLAQEVATGAYPSSEVVVFNAPGVGGFGGTTATNDNVSYYYSD